MVDSQWTSSRSPPHPTLIYYHPPPPLACVCKGERLLTNIALLGGLGAEAMSFLLTYGGLGEEGEDQEFGMTCLYNTCTLPNS